MTATVHVALGNRSYDIVTGERLLANAGDYIAPLLGESKRAIVITDEQVARFYLHTLTGALEKANIQHRCLIVAAGEQSKSMESFARLMEQLLEQSPDRQTMLIALGGGVVGDLTGFAASVLLRGVPFVQIPTTLLAQVDSSVGGKTGINSRYGKNLIGSFYQPKLVLADVGTLATLSERERKAGYAEVLKYGLINDVGFFAWLEQHGQAVLTSEVGATAEAIAISCKAKAAIVAADEREGGVRALLNFGHTFGHALEAETGYSDRLLHGEAVAIGMALAMRMSVAMGLCPKADLDRMLTHYQATNLPGSPLDIRTDWDVDALMAHFEHDKKTEGGKLTFILSRGIGKAFIAKDVDKRSVRELLLKVCG